MRGEDSPVVDALHATLTSELPFGFSGTVMYKLVVVLVRLSHRR